MSTGPADDRQSGAAELAAREDRRLRGVAIVFVLGLVIVAGALGLVLVPLAQARGGGGDLWSTMCRAIGIGPATARADEAVPRSSAVPLSLPPGAPVPSRVAWNKATLDAVRAGSATAGETVARSFCISCHLPNGTSPLPLTPRLAGQSVFALYKQLHDYKSGARVHPTMTALVAVLNEQQMADVAAYYASLPHEGPDARAPANVSGEIANLVVRGDSTRALPPCVACHAVGTGGPLEQPTLNGQYQDYIAGQLQAYASGQRRNDLFGRMRSVSQALRPEEIDALAKYYGRAR